VFNSLTHAGSNVDLKAYDSNVSVYIQLFAINRWELVKSCRLIIIQVSPSWPSPYHDYSARYRLYCHILRSMNCLLYNMFWVVILFDILCDVDAIV